MGLNSLRKVVPQTSENNKRVDVCQKRTKARLSLNIGSFTSYGKNVCILEDLGTVMGLREQRELDQKRSF